MIADDSEKNAPYEENGLPIEAHIKKGCAHHSHGLDNPGPIDSFIKNIAE